MAMSQIGASLAFEMIFIAELLRYFTWLYVLHHAIGYYQDESIKFDISNFFSPLFVSILFIMAFIILVFNDSIILLLKINNPNIIQFAWLMVFAIIGLILVEQLYRNTSHEFRWKISFLCISAGSIFIYDFFVFSNAFLVQKIDYEYWSARGIVNVLVAPTLLISAARNPSLSPNIHISRQFVFHSTTLIGSGLYLIIMSLAGYYIKIRSGEWGELLQSTFLFAALLLLASLFFSSKLKVKIKRYVNRSFSNKYDYREEWNRFSNTLLTNDDDLSIHLRSLQAVSQIVDSQGAQLWLKDHNKFNYHAYWGMPVPPPPSETEDSILIKFIEKNNDIITQKEFKNSENSQSIPDHWFIKDSKGWLIVPLRVNNLLFGFIHLQSSLSSLELDHEDRELLSTIAHHVALYLSQNESTLALQEAEKFKSINQMTAFLTHDLKTLLSQLFLLVENGKIHKDNPAFIEDMLITLEHVSKKIQRLVLQLKEPEIRDFPEKIKLLDILNDILNDYKHSPVRPELINTDDLYPLINANRSELKSALKHIIQNAVESVCKNGLVKIELTSSTPANISIIIMDNGKGMSAEFIANHLFRPFDSTKGVSGMGIGVYQSREYIRTLKGDIQVASIEKSGTTFTITLPIETNHT